MINICNVLSSFYYECIEADNLPTKRCDRIVFIHDGIRQTNRETIVKFEQLKDNTNFFLLNKSILKKTIHT
ncbi:unnamed protein product [Rotaria sordida]|uniref:Uncharacterized protein n=1 Tax=Rotaria sordida TaxID=392033 RepID=A0A814TXN7_9BILA|nr:unnamed protein product [Rotaria sordida]